MNLLDSCFLCLDVGTHGVRGLAHRVCSANIEKQAFFAIENNNTVNAIRSVVDELEKQIGKHFDSAYITGNFGPSEFDVAARTLSWSGDHKITTVDIKNQISQVTPPEDFFPMHIVPLRYDTPTGRNISSPVGYTDRQLSSVFGFIFYSKEGLNKIYDVLHAAHIQPIAFLDPHFVQSAAYKKPNQTTMFIDFGAEYTSASIWTNRGPVWHTKINLGGTNITNAIAEKFNLNIEDADRIKRAVASLVSTQMDRFTPADTAYDFSRADINEVVLPMLAEIIEQIKNRCLSSFTKCKPTRIVLTGGGAEIDGLRDFIENAFAATTEVIPVDASVRALSDFIWNEEEAHRQAYLAKKERWEKRFNKIKNLFHKKPKAQPQLVPILPSTLCFDMSKPETYTLFRSGCISMIHVDIMDGFYVDKVTGGIDELKKIREKTSSHLHVHLMTESPNIWAADAIAAGADTVILSTNTSGLRTAIRTVRAAGKRVGIAINPESSVTILKTVLREIDEVMIMSVKPGEAGQQFEPACLHKISILAKTRKKYGLKFVISVDGGINDKNAQYCWEAGANLLVSGSYLADAPDFPLAVQSLLRKDNNSCETI
jgi:ribulose-phosphate 3-epimerase